MHQQEHTITQAASVNVVGVIGCGKMGGAIASGLLAKGDGPALLLFDAVAALPEAIAARYPGRAKAVKTVDEVLEGAQAVVIAVKPGDVFGVLEAARGVTSSLLFVSVAAGLQSQALRDATAAHHRVVRVMPNTPSLIGEGCASLLADKAVSAADAAAVAALFSPLGEVVALDKEALMDAATGLAGSGPAFVALFVEALADAAVVEGLPRAMALKMAAQTVRGAASLMLEQHPAVVKDSVGSPGGTTMAGVCAAEAHGLRAAVIAAVRAAVARSREMRSPSAV